MKTFKFIDNQFPKNKITHTRNVVRAFVINENNEVAIIRIKGEDIFGVRDYYETPGGGVKKYERKISALKREILEEVGVTIKDITPIARVVDYYNLINRRNDNYYFYCYVDEYKEKHLEEYEKTLFEKVEWIPINDLLNSYLNVEDKPISILVKQREIPVIRLFLDMINHI